jgi:hypothetical protein
MRGKKGARPIDPTLRLHNILPEDALGKSQNSVHDVVSPDNYQQAMLWRLDAEIVASTLP